MTISAPGENRVIRRFTLSLVLSVTLLLILGLGAQSLLTLRLFEREVTPELGQKAQVVARTIAAQVERLAVVGNPLDRLNGLPDFARQVAGRYPEITRVTVRDTAGTAVQSVDLRNTGEAGAAAEAEHPVVVRGAAIGRIAVAYDLSVVERALTELIYDILTTLLVAALLAFELVLVVVTTGVAEPIRQFARVMAEAGEGHLWHLMSRTGIGEIRHVGERIERSVSELYQRYRTAVEYANDAPGGPPPEAERLIERLGTRFNAAAGGPKPIFNILADDIRLPLFIFFLSTELSRSFMPIFAQEVYEPILGLPREVAITLPIAGYMAFGAIGTPYAGTLVERFGVRRVFIGGLIPSLIAYVMVALSESLTELILWRCIGAVGAAAVTIAALGHIAMFSGEKARASGMAIYSGTFVAAGICGSSIGGILADRMGFNATFLVSGALTFLSAVVALRLLDRAIDLQTLPRKRTKLRDIGQVMAEPSFAILVLGVAIPAGVVTMGHLFFTLPLLLAELGETQSSIGRYIMLYFITMILLNYLAARRADRSGGHYVYLTIGILAMAAAPILAAVSQTPLILGLSIVCVGIGNALCGPAQGAVLLGLSERKSQAGTQHTIAIAVFRVLERVGLVIGPIAAAALSARFGRIEESWVLGGITLGCAVLFIVHAAATGKLRPPAPAETKP